MTDAVTRPPHPATPSPSRRAIVKGAAWAAPAAMVSMSMPAFAASPLDCQPAGTLFDARAGGRLLSGQILGLDLDAIAEVEGAEAVATGTAAVTDSNPLSVTALSALRVDLGGVATALTDILSVVANQELGTVNQFARAVPAAEGADTAEIGAAGVVDDSGAIALSPSAANPPELGTLDLRSVLTQVTGDSAVTALLSSVADLRLDIGAVGARSFTDSLCTVPDPDDTDAVQREYLLAYLRLAAESDLLGGVVTGITEGLDSLTLSTDALFDAIEAVPGVGGILGGLLSALAGEAVDLSLSLDTASLAAPLPDNVNAPLVLNLGEGSVTVDVASILGGPYTGGISPFLNNLAPNTRLFVDAPLPTGALVSAVDELVDSLLDRILGLLQVRIQVGRVSGLAPTGLLIEGSLAQLLEGQGTVTLRLAGVPLQLGELLGGVLQSVGGLVEGLVGTLLDSGGVLQVLSANLNQILGALFDVLSGVVSLTVNAQNDPAVGFSAPDYYSAIPAGRFDVSTLHVETLGAVDLLDLSLGRGFTGPNTARA